jgi:hypothetical protein
MKQWLRSVWAMALVLVFSAASFAAMAMFSGEVIKYEVGKTISVKDPQGMVHALEITKDTKVEGDVKVGAKVSVEAEGKTAQSVKATLGG